MMSRTTLSKDSIEEKMTGVFDLELNEGHAADVDSDEDAIEVDQVRGVSIVLFSHQRTSHLFD